MRKYNVALIILDALRSQNLPMYGYSINTAPFLEKLSKDGVVFENAYSTTDQTDPSFTTIMSGRYPLVHGITRHGPDVTSKHISLFYKTNTKLITEFLKKIGYKTIGIDWLGRWHKKGYDVYSPPCEVINYKIPFGARVNKVMKKLLTNTVDWFSYSLIAKLGKAIGYCQDESAYFTINAAKKLISRTDKPFFLLMHLWDTHTPFDILPEFLVREFYNGECSETVEEMVKRIKNEKWRRKVLKYHLKGIKCVDEIEPRYNASIKYADHFIEEFIDFLKDVSKYNESIIIVTGDHGENLVRNNIFIGHGGLFQRVIKVPFIIVAPDIPSNKRIKYYVQHIDILPTVLDILHVKIKGYYLNGRSLLQTIYQDEPIRDYVFAVSSTAKRRYSLIKGNYKIVYSPTLSDAMDKYGGIWFQSQIELYNLKKDSDDQLNIAEENPDITREYINETKKILKEHHRVRLRLILQKINI